MNAAEITERLRDTLADLDNTRIRLQSLMDAVAALPPASITAADLLTTSEIAAMFGVKTHTVTTWKERDRLPPPFAVKPSGPIWLRSQIEAVRVERGLPAWQ